MKTAILFAGQGSQYQKMGLEMLELYPEYKYIFEKGSEILGFDFFEVVNYGNEELSNTLYAQPLIMATSLIAYEIGKAKGIEAEAIAGHSLGEYAGMVAAGILSLEDGFRVIKARSEAMAKIKGGSMAAIVGLSEEKVGALCEAEEGYVIPANYNTPSQTVISGEESAIDGIIGKITAEKQKGVRGIKLSVSAAFHTKLMESAAKEFIENISWIEFSEGKIPFYSNVTGELKEEKMTKEYLAKHLVSPVLFTKELENLKKAGIEKFVECGPSKVLSGLVKKTLSEVEIINIEDKKSIEKML